MIRFSGSGMNYASIFGYGGGFGNSFFNNLSQLSSVRSSTFSKALKTYYGNAGTSARTQRNAQSGRYSAYSNLDSANLNLVNKESTELALSAGKLTDTGRDSLFQDADSYDADDAYKAVRDFVDEYNDTVSAVGKSVNSTVNSVADGMSRLTDAMRSSLSKVGITAGKDGKLSLNEKEFKKADMDTVKSVFGGAGSYAKMIGSAAERIGNAAGQQSLSNAEVLYSRYGLLSNPYFGSYFNRFF
ncbi:MAG: hypothetical protein IJU50_08110 [Lachnospiraceae bacterium]|nr:hypothetical protein [Lachnospiraceae bacterium]